MRVSMLTGQGVQIPWATIYLIWGYQCYGPVNTNCCKEIPMEIFQNSTAEGSVIQELRLFLYGVYIKRALLYGCIVWG